MKRFFWLFALISCLGVQAQLPPSNIYTELLVFKAVAVYEDGVQVPFSGEDYFFLDRDDDGDFWVISWCDSEGQWASNGTDLVNTTREGSTYNGSNGNFEDLTFMLSPGNDMVLVSKPGSDIVVAYESVNGGGSSSYDYTNSYPQYGGSNYGGSSDNYSRSGRSSGNGNGFSLSEQNAYNRDKQTYSNYESQLSRAQYGNGSMSTYEWNNIVSKMASLRTKWENRGKSFPKSSLERRK